MHFDLGLTSIPSDEDGRTQYWHRIRDIIVGVGHVSPRGLSTLLLLGEDAGHTDFVNSVEDALRVLMPGFDIDIPRKLVDQRNPRTSPLYLAARGAAELANRAQERMESGNRVRSHRLSDEHDGDQVVFIGS